MSEFFYRPCCDAGADRGVGYFLPKGKPTLDGVEVDVSSLTAASAPPPPKLDAATHEAAHALVLHAQGYLIDTVQVGARSFIRRAPGEGERMTDKEQIALATAGDLGGQLADRWLPYRREAADIDAAIARVKTGCAGGCDDCLAARFAIHIAEQDPTIEARDAMRAGEHAAYAIISSSQGARAIRALGDVLIEKAAMDGAAVHAFFERFVPFGSAKEIQ